MTRKFGIVGENIGYSLSPAIYNRLFHDLKVDAEYLLYDLGPNALETFISTVRFAGIAGFNITTPHKETIARFADRKDKLVEDTSSVNLIMNRNRLLQAYNTDFEGIRYSIEECLNFDVHGKDVSIIGSGGAAHTVYYYLCSRRARKVTVFHRSAPSLLRFGVFARRWHEQVDYRPVIYENRIESLSECDLCVNCTPKSYAELVDTRDQERPRRIFELRYGNYAVFGKHHLRGNPMLAAQATANFRIMTGEAVKVSRILGIINEELNID